MTGMPGTPEYASFKVYKKEVSALWDKVTWFETGAKDGASLRDLQERILDVEVQARTVSHAAEDWLHEHRKELVGEEVLHG